MKKNIIFFIAALIGAVGTLLIYHNWDLWYAAAENYYYAAQYTITKPKTYNSRIEKHIIYSSYLHGASKEVIIYLPRQYDENKTQRFPVVYLLHGYPGHDQDWLINANLQARLDEKIMKGKIPPVIVIFPDMNGPIIHDSEYIDANRIDQKMESYFIRELIPYIDKNYRTLPKRAIGGLSSGGYGALYLGVKYSRLFSYIFAHSGYMTNHERIMKKLVANYVETDPHYNIFELIRALKETQKLYIYFDIGRQDNKRYTLDNRRFDKFLLLQGIRHDYQVTDGSHGWRVWSHNIDYSLDKLKFIF